MEENNEYFSFLLFFTCKKQVQNIYVDERVIYNNPITKIITKTFQKYYSHVPTFFLFIYDMADLNISIDKTSAIFKNKGFIENRLREVIDVYFSNITYVNTLGNDLLPTSPCREVFNNTNNSITPLPEKYRIKKVDDRNKLLKRTPLGEKNLNNISNVDVKLSESIEIKSIDYSPSELTATNEIRQINKGLMEYETPILSNSPSIYPKTVDFDDVYTKYIDFKFESNPINTGLEFAETSIDLKNTSSDLGDAEEKNDFSIDYF